MESYTGVVVYDRFFVHTQMQFDVVCRMRMGVVLGWDDYLGGRSRFCAHVFVVINLMGFPPHRHKHTSCVSLVVCLVVRWCGLSFACDVCSFVLVCPSNA